MTPLRAVIWAAVSTKEQTQDKDSLPNQIEAGRALCVANDWQLIRTLEVPGFSRDYFDIQECADDMAKEGITAFKELLTLWDQRAFDILIVRGADRFARTQALHSRVVEYTVRIVKARIYVASTGTWIDSSNFRYFTAIDGLRAASEVDEMRRRRADGMPHRVAKGLPSSRPPFSHCIVYEDHKPVTLIVDQSKRRLLDDLATVFLEGFAFDWLEEELYTRFGHVNPDTGKRYSYSTLRKGLYSPFFWGHSALYYHPNGASLPTGGKAAWVYDESLPPPNGVLLWRNTHEPAYTGDLAAKVKAQLHFREGLRGKQAARTTHAFSGLLYCGVCGRRLNSRMTKSKYGIYTYWFCHTSLSSKPLRETSMCTQKHVTRDEDIRRDVTGILQEYFEAGDILSLGRREPDRAALDRLEAEIADATGQLNQLIEDQSREKRVAVRTIYAEKIDALGERLDILIAQRDHQVSLAQASAIARQVQVTASNRLKEQGVENTMAMPEHELNQFLFLLLGDSRFIVENRHIVEVKEV